MSERSSGTNFWASMSPVFKFLIVFFGAGVIWGTTVAAISQKADKVDVERIAGDIHTIKLILCEQATKDSFCRGAN